MHHYHLAAVTLQQVYIFLSVAETCNFSHSAEHLNMTQPGISKSLSKLEEILGFRLFERNRQMVRLTAAGQRLYEDWSNGLSHFERGYEEADNSWERQINLGIDFTIDGTIINHYVKTWNQRNPDIKLHLFENGSTLLQEQLDAGILDLILVPEFLRKTPYGEGKGSSLATVCTFQVIVPADHPLATYDVLSLEDIVDLPLIMFDPTVNNGILEDTKRLFLPYGKSPQVSCYYKSTYEMRTFLSEGKGISIITNSYAYQMDDCCKRIPLTTKCWGTAFLYQKPTEKLATNKKPVLKFLEMVEELRPTFESLS